jgi:hypothetical protein
MATAATHMWSGPRRLLIASGPVAIVLVVALALVVFFQDRSGSDPTTEGSGVAAVETRSLSSFTAVDLAGTNDVRVNIGPEQKVLVRADDNLVAQVTTQVRKGTLVVSEHGSFEAATPMSVEVTVPGLEALTLSGAGTGTLSVEGVDAPRFSVRLDGTGLVVVRGRADHVDATLAGTGNAQLQDLVARDVVATVLGTGRLQVHATRSLGASVSGTGSIVYDGNPRQVTRSVTGTGAISEE